MNLAKSDLDYEPIVTREQGMAELATWLRDAQPSA
jgi:hypothetical protein